MYCNKYKKDVLVQDCEECITNRACDELCVKREFVWGVPDNTEPRWVYSEKEAKNISVDVSYFFDPKWEGNQHLTQNKISISTEIYIKEKIPVEIRWKIWGKDNFTCKCCGIRKNLTIDHIVPEIKGGNLSLDNLQTLCKSCNSKKNTKTIKY